MSEEMLTRNLVNRVKNDFDILREVDGYNPLYKENMRIDIMLKAKPHLVELGFTGNWFGVECKWFDRFEGATSKSTRLVWQSITYAQSYFVINGEKVIPEFVAVHTPSLEPLIESHLSKLLSLGLYGNVGKLFFYRDNSWCIKFASNYARSTSDGYYVNAKQLPKRRAGSV